MKKYKKVLDYLINNKTRPMKEKKIAIYLMRRFTPLTNQEIGSIFNMKDQAVSKAAINTEKLIKQDKRLKRELKELVSSFGG